MEYPSFFGLTDRLFWLVAVLLIVVNTMIMKARAAVDVKSHPERKAGYDRLILGSMVCLGLFLAYPTIAILTGGITSVFELIDPQQMSVLILGFYAYWFVLVAAVLYWVWFRGGIGTCASHPAIFNLPKSESGLRLFFGGMTVFFVVAAVSTAVLRLSGAFR